MEEEEKEGWEIGGWENGEDVEGWGEKEVEG